MPYSYNGWYASRDLPLRPLVVAGEAFVPGILDNDDVYTILQFVAQQMHERVEPIYREGWHEMDDWGYSYRETTNDDSLSCHASGTAIDYNATRHPYNVAVTANFTMAQVATIHDIIDDLPIVWGGDYRYSVDAMHFEIMGSRDAVAAAADRIRNRDEDDMKAEDFQRIREIVREEIDAQFAEQIEVKTESGTRRITYTQLLRELWQKINKHT